jgi:hypothetical protein
MPSYALISTNPSSPPPHAHGGWGGGGTESTEGVGRQEPPSASNQCCQVAASLLGRLFQNPRPVWDPLRPAQISINQSIKISNKV